MSEKDHHRETYGPAFWLATGVGSAMLAGQLVLRAMRAMHQAGAPARMMMKGPFGAAGWMFGQTDDAQPEPQVAPKPAPRAKAVVTEAEVVAVEPEAAPVVPSPVEAVAEAAEVAEPVIEATREAAETVVETVSEAPAEELPAEDLPAEELPAEEAPAATEDVAPAEEPAALAEMLEPESEPDEAVAEVAPEAEDAPEEAASEKNTAPAPIDPARPTALAEPRGAADDLKRIKGIGPKLAGVLNDLGYYHFDQIAAWGPEEIAVVDESLGTFAGRALRDDWIGQAKALAAGETTD